MQTFGYSLEEIPSLEQWYPKAYPDEKYQCQVKEQWRMLIKQAIQDGKEIEPHEFRITCLDGTIRNMLISGTFIGKEFLAAFQDITSLKQATEKIRILSQAVEFCPSMILITDAIGRVEYANPAWETVTGYRLEEVIGQKPRALKSGMHTREFYAHLWGEISAGKTWWGEFCNRRKNGELYWESAAIAPLYNDEGVINRYVAVKEDITADKRAAEELQTAKEAAEAANRAKSAFLANMSHEIRTPMNAILGFAQLLLRESDLSIQQRQQLTTISRSGDHLMDIINDILEMSRIESGRVTLNAVNCDLHLMLEDLERMFSLRAHAKNLRFKVEFEKTLPRYILVDETKLRQIIINLVGNAFKFTPSGGQIVLRVQSKSELESSLRILYEIEDTGPGIAPEDLKNLFQAFFQTSTGKSTSGGTGLGLAISRQFVRMMGGEMTVNSKQGVGSIFRFDIQVSLGESVQMEVGDMSGHHAVHLLPGIPACRILIVDDMELNRTLLSRILEPLGFEIQNASNGAEAIAQCQAWKPHLILMDLRMPGMDGYEASRKIRYEHGDTIKIIAISASAFEEHQNKAREAGMNAFIAKPFKPSELLETIKQLAGVDYIYRSENGTAAEPVRHIPSEVPIEQEIHRLPVELVNQLYEATCRAEYDLMLSIVDQIAARETSIGQRLRQLVEQFDYASLQEILKSK